MDLGTLFMAGAHVTCADGTCGKLDRFIVDPATWIVSYFVIGLRRHERLVSPDLVDTDAHDLRLRCTVAQFERLRYAKTAQPLGCGPGTARELAPPGNVVMRRGLRVVAIDKPAGRLKGLIMEISNHHVSHLLIRKEHYWFSHKLTVPTVAVTLALDDLIELRMTAGQIQELKAPLATHRGAGIATREDDAN